jgi:hypothetical protein
MRFTAILITAIFVIVSLFFPLKSTAEDNKYAGSFLELGIGGRAMAMGGAFVSVADDGSAFYWNPAGASTLMQPELFGMYASLFKSLERHHQIGFTRPVYGGAGISLNWIRLSVADIPRYDSNNLVLDYSTRVNEASTSASSWQELQELGIVLTDAPKGFSSFTNDAFFLTLAKTYKLDIDFGWQYFVFPTEIPIGLNVKFIRQSLFGQTASGLGFDFGTMFKFGLNDLFDDNRLGKVAFGLAVKDIFETKLTWNTATRQSGNIRRSWNLGASYFQPLSGINGKLLFAYAFEVNYNRVHHFGFEYLYHERLALRFGLDNQQFTAGVGIKVAVFNFDYAYKGHELGGSHRISTSIRF